jgi:ATP-binding cassette, subfamily F, member 2
MDTEFVHIGIGFWNCHQCFIHPCLSHLIYLLVFPATNPLDMESIDALARCVNKFKGGVIMISHDMRLISQCAEQIYICDHKKVTRYEGDIMKFKLHQKKENQKNLAQHMNG